METFLKKIAQRIVADHPKDTDQVLVVFNNNRSKRFFLKQFDTFGQATFLPQVTAIDEMIKQLSGLEIVQNEFLLFELYNIHKQIGGPERKYQTFEDFISFGELMMGDFSEIDQYMVDARRIFYNVYELKHIGEWDISGKPLTEFQRHYLEFYRSLYQYYVELRKKLLEDKKAYSGMAYRKVAEEIGTLADDCPYSGIYFIGFNALSRCEERIIGEYVRRGIGHLLADNDIYYLEPDQVGEAGYFLDKHMQDFPELKPEGPSCFEHKPKHITIVDCPENILQCKYAGQLLSTHTEWLSPKEAESTALVLADEKLLIPTLNALPDLDKKYNVNITMGYAYADSMVHALMTKVFSLYRQHSARGYYHSDIVEVLADRSVSMLLESPGLRRKVEYLMRKENHIRCNHDEIMSLLQRTDAKNLERADYLFPDTTPTPEGCLALLRRLATAIVGNDLLESNPKEKQCLGSLAEILDNLEELLSSYPDTVANIDTLEKIYNRIATRHSISLIGEPLMGLQILGMLETRNLDFKRVILLSTNEGILPGGRGGNTLIPLFLKSEAGLPTYVEKDNVYAYHFYRLLQRAEDIYLLYSSESEAMGKGEASRFIKQVECELAPKFGIEVDHISVKADTQLASAQATAAVEKNEALMQRLAEMGQSGLSPTSFCDYIDCPQKYYYTRVLKVDENENIDEDLNASQLGSCIHAVLEKVYGVHLNQPLKAQVMDEALKELPQLMEKAFQEAYSGGRNTEGRNRFLYSVAESQLKHIFQQEKARLERGERLIVKGVEEKIEGYAITPEVNLKGTIDRVDELEGCLRIIDYKTGRLDKEEITYDEEKESMPGKWLQLMWYALLYCRIHHPATMVKSGIYPLRNLRSDVKMATWHTGDDNSPEAVTPEKLDRFEELLREKVEELMNRDIPFIATPSDKACRYCPAKTFCSSAQ